MLDPHTGRDVAGQAPTPIFARFRSDPDFAAFYQFVHRLELVAGVEQIRFATTSETIHLWVLTATDDLAANRAIFQVERAFRESQGHASLEMHLVPLSDVDVNHLPPTEILVSTPGA